MLKEPAQLEIIMQMLDNPPFCEDLEELVEIGKNSLEALDGIQVNF
jgi:hypothetical protein